METPLLRVQELEQERSELEKDKARFLDQAMRRDKKSFVFSCPPRTPLPQDGSNKNHDEEENDGNSDGDSDCFGRGDDSFSTPSHFRSRPRGHLAGDPLVIVPSFSPLPNGGRGVAERLTLMTFTPPTASPDTARLLEELGIEPRVGGVER